MSMFETLLLLGRNCFNMTAGGSCIVARMNRLHLTYQALNIKAFDVLYDDQQV